jgi:mannose-1-phosphate guanylyltransferase/mannose-6-phosphate isomerase
MSTVGDIYLADLVSQEYISTVLELGTSNALERALSTRLPPGRYLRLVRGEHSDSYIERALLFDEPRARIVKLRGDLIGRSAGRFEQDQPLGTAFRNSLKQVVRSSDLIWVGPIVAGFDVDAILASEASSIWWITPEASMESASRLSSRHELKIIDGATARYDAFFRELGLQTSRLALKPLAREGRRRLNEQLRSKLPVDITYSDQLIQRLAQQIRLVCDEWRTPTLLVYIHDPAAPGGSEVEKRIHRYLRTHEGAEPDSTQIVVQGASIRWIDRHAGSVSITGPKANYSKIVIVDSISFTGRTLKLASEHIRTEWPSAETFWAVLVAFQDLLSEIEPSDLPPDHLLYAAKTDRPDIYFPWGWTQATSSIVRRFLLHESVHKVTVDQRPWGTLEIIADQIPCSVRMLTIRAGHRLSFHNHAVRDELFVALDGEVGIEFDREDDQAVEAVVLARGEYIVVPRGVRHRFAAYRDTVRLLEIAFGLYDQVYDIERYSDDYGRVGKLGDI